MEWGHGHSGRNYSVVTQFQQYRREEKKRRNEQNTRVHALQKTLW